jgi:hypothetical protein
MTLPNFNNTRRFGIEIETSGLTVSAAVAAVRACGVRCEDEGYHHEVRDYWKVVLDGSVNDGCEVVSPPLSGNAGLEEVIKVAAALRDAGALPNRSCGLHVHVDASDLDGRTIVNAVRRYARHEATIDTFIPPTRRVSTWARSMRDIAMSFRSFDLAVVNPSTNSILNAFGAGRYYKLNLRSLLVHGTLEFRHHGGTIDGIKMANWIMFCVQFIEDSKVSTTVPAVTVPAPATEAVSQVSVGTSPGVTVRLSVDAPAVPSATALTPERRNAITRRFRAFLSVLYNTTPSFCGDDATIATALGISQASIPSYVSMFRDAYPNISVIRRRNRGYYSNSQGEIAALLGATSVPAASVAAPVPAATTTPVSTVCNCGPCRRARDAQSATQTPATQPARPAITVPDPLPLANLPIEVVSYLNERAMEFGN